MAVITMAQKNSLVSRLKKDYPSLHFKGDEVFRWSPSGKTIFYPRTMTSEDDKTLLHELAHAILDHVDYRQDIELIHKEREAWDYALQKLSTQYKISITENDVEDAMDSYRDWLHRRSTCPECSSNAPQQPKNTYKCVACGCSWRANDARICELRRYKVKVA